MDHNCRIGKVTLKDKKITVFNNYAKLNTKHNELLKQIRNLFVNAPKDFDGFIVMGWNKDQSNIMLEWDSGVIPYDCLAEFAKEKLRRSVDNAIYTGSLRFGDDVNEDDTEDEDDF